MCQSIWSFNTTPIPHGNPWFFTQKAFPGGKKFEYCLGGVGNLNKKSKVFPEEYICFNNWTRLKVLESAFLSKRLRIKI